MCENVHVLLNSLTEGRVLGAILVLQKIYPDWTKQQLKEFLLTIFTTPSECVAVNDCLSGIKEK